MLVPTNTSSCPSCLGGSSSLLTLSRCSSSGSPVSMTSVAADVRPLLRLGVRCLLSDLCLCFAGLGRGPSQKPWKRRSLISSSEYAGGGDHFAYSSCQEALNWWPLPGSSCTCMAAPVVPPNHLVGCPNSLFVRSDCESQMCALSARAWILCLLLGLDFLVCALGGHLCG